MFQTRRPFFSELVAGRGVTRGGDRDSLDVFPSKGLAVGGDGDGIDEAVVPSDAISAVVAVKQSPLTEVRAPSGRAVGRDGNDAAGEPIPATRERS